MNPDLPPIREFTGPRADAVDTMLREVVADSRPAVRAPRRLVPVLVGALVAGGAVAGASLAHQVFAPATDRSLARYHTTADLGSVGGMVQQQPRRGHRDDGSQQHPGHDGRGRPDPGALTRPACRRG